MKLNQFSSHYAVTGVEKGLYEKFTEAADGLINNQPEIQSLIDQFGGATFDNGLFRIHNDGSFYHWTKLAGEFFKKYQGTCFVFGFDWMGRHFALTDKGNQSTILLLDPATAEVFELESTIEQFLNVTLVSGKEDLLEEEKFKQVRRISPNDLSFNHCIGFVLPLFLGGKDEISNLEDSDMEVYWELSYQFYRQIKNLPPGTPLNVSIK